jgi:hypothetical protein
MLLFSELVLTLETHKLFIYLCGGPKIRWRFQGWLPELDCERHFETELEGHFASESPDCVYFLFA